MKSTNIEGVVLKVTAYGELHKIVTLLTKEHGKISVMAHGAKKTKGKLAGITQLFTHGNYLITSNNKGMDVMKQGETITRFRTLHQDIYKTIYSSVILELANYLAVENEPNSRLFEIVFNALRLIDKGMDPFAISLIVQVKLLHDAGIEPNINGCTCCGGVKGYFAFSVKEQGFICNECFSNDHYRMPVTTETISVFCSMQRVDLSTIQRMDISERVIFEIDKILTAVYTEYTGIELKSKNFIKSLHSPLMMVQ